MSYVEEVVDDLVGSEDGGMSSREGAAASLHDGLGNRQGRAAARAVDDPYEDAAYDDGIGRSVSFGEQDARAGGWRGDDLRATDLEHREPHGWDDGARWKAAPPATTGTSPRRAASKRPASGRKRGRKVSGRSSRKPGSSRKSASPRPSAAGMPLPSVPSGRWDLRTGGGFILPPPPPGEAMIDPASIRSPYGQPSRSTKSKPRGRSRSRGKGSDAHREDPPLPRLSGSWAGEADRFEGGAGRPQPPVRNGHEPRRPSTAGERRQPPAMLHGSGPPLGSAPPGHMQIVDAQGNTVGYAAVTRADGAPSAGGFAPGSRPGAAPLGGSGRRDAGAGGWGMTAQHQPMAPSPTPPTEAVPWGAASPRSAWGSGFGRGGPVSVAPVSAAGGAGGGATLPFPQRRAPRLGIAFQDVASVRPSAGGRNPNLAAAAAAVRSRRLDLLSRLRPSYAVATVTTAGTTASARRRAAEAVSAAEGSAAEASAAALAAAATSEMAERTAEEAEARARAAEAAVEDLEARVRTEARGREEAEAARRSAEREAEDAAARARRAVRGEEDAEARAGAAKRALEEADDAGRRSSRLLHEAEARAEAAERALQDEVDARGAAERAAARGDAAAGTAADRAEAAERGRKAAEAKAESETRRREEADARTVLAGLAARDAEAKAEAEAEARAAAERELAAEAEAREDAEGRLHDAQEAMAKERRHWERLGGAPALTPAAAAARAAIGGGPGATPARPQPASGSADRPPPPPRRPQVGFAEALGGDAAGPRATRHSPRKRGSAGAGEAPRERRPRDPRGLGAAAAAAAAAADGSPGPAPSGTLQDHPTGPGLSPPMLRKVSSFRAEPDTVIKFVHDESIPLPGGLSRSGRALSPRSAGSRPPVLRLMVWPDPHLVEQPEWRDEPLPEGKERVGLRLMAIEAGEDAPEGVYASAPVGDAGDANRRAVLESVLNRSAPGRVWMGKVMAELTIKKSAAKRRRLRAKAGARLLQGLKAATDGQGLSAAPGVTLVRVADSFRASSTVGGDGSPSEAASRGTSAHGAIAPAPTRRSRRRSSAPGTKAFIQQVATGLRDGYDST